MTPHDHREFVAGCFRCELGRDEAADAMRHPRRPLHSFRFHDIPLIRPATDFLRREVEDDSPATWQALFYAIEYLIEREEAGDTMGQWVLDQVEDLLTPAFCERSRIPSSSLLEGSDNQEGR